MTDTRKFIPFPEATAIITPFGTVYATPTGRDHVSITTTSSVDSRIVINGVGLSTHIHLYRNDDNTWTYENPAEADNPYRRFPITARRCDNYENASDAAIKKIVNGLIPLLVTWCEDNDDLFYVAERGRLSNEILTAAVKCADAEAAYLDARECLDAAVEAERGFLNR